MAGRKSKLTLELIKQAEKLLSNGNYEATVIDYLGIDKSTWYKWKAEGEKAKDGIKKEFFDRIKKAMSKSQAIAVSGILAAGKKSWQALAWFLERKYPEMWATKNSNVGGNDGSIDELVKALEVSRKDNQKPPEK